MKKIKLESKTLFKYIHIFIIIGNIFIFFHLYNFLNEYVYKSFAIDQTYLEDQVRMKDEGIDKLKFDEANTRIEKKLNKTIITEKNSKENYASTNNIDE